MEEIQSFLLDLLSERLGVGPRALDARDRFSRYGLDSAGAASIIADLGAALGRPLSPTLVWRYPTIEALARYLATGASVIPPSPEEGAGRATLDEPIAIVGIACRFP